MARTYKGWTKVSKKDAEKDGYYFSWWYKEGYPDITDFMDGTSAGFCNKESRYEVGIRPGQPYERSEYRSFAKLSDAILYAETGKYRWEV